MFLGTKITFFFGTAKTYRLFFVSLQPKKEKYGTED